MYTKQPVITPAFQTSTQLHRGCTKLLSMGDTSISLHARKSHVIDEKYFVPYKLSAWLVNAYCASDFFAMSMLA